MFCSTRRMVSPPPLQLLDHSEDALHDDGRETERGLVHHQQFRLRHHGPPDGEHLLLAAGEGAGELHVTLSQHGEQIVDLFQRGASLRLGPLVAAPHQKVLVHREIGEQLAALGHLHHAKTHDIVGGHGAEGLSVEHDPPRFGADHPGDGVDKGGFSRSIRSHDTDDQPIFYRQGDIVQGLEGRVLDAQILDLKQRSPPLQDTRRGPPGERRSPSASPRRSSDRS